MLRIAICLAAKSGLCNPASDLETAHLILLTLGLKLRMSLLLALGIFQPRRNNSPRANRWDLESRRLLGQKTDWFESKGDRNRIRADKVQYCQQYCGKT